MLKNIVIDTNGPIAAALQIGIKKLVEEQEAKTTAIASRMNALYEELTDLDARRQEIHETLSDLASQKTQADSTVDYLKNQAKALSTVLAEA